MAINVARLLLLPLLLLACFAVAGTVAQSTCNAHSVEEMNTCSADLTTAIVLESATLSSPLGAVFFKFHYVTSL